MDCGFPQLKNGNGTFYASTPKRDDADHSHFDPPIDCDMKSVGSPGQSDKVDGVNDTGKAPNGREKLHSGSSCSIDVLSGGESEYESLRKRHPRRDDSLGRLLQPSVGSNGTFRNEYMNVDADTSDLRLNRRFPVDVGFYIAKELLMTERTYKKDLEVITIWLRDTLPEDMEKQLCDELLWEPLEKLTVHQTTLLRALEVRLGARVPQFNNNSIDSNEPQPLNSADPYFIGQLMLDCIQETLPMYQVWADGHLNSLKRLENACNQNPTLERLCREFESHQKACYLPLYTFALKPLYRLLHYKQILFYSLELYSMSDDEYKIIKECLSLLQPLCQTVEESLTESLNYYYLCLLRRDMDGFDTLVNPNRKFIRQGCLFKYTSKGPQQRMFFLFSDILVYSNKGYSSQQQFKVHGVIPIHSIQIELAEYTNSFSIYGGARAMTLSASSSEEREAWMFDLEKAASATNGETIENALISRNMINSNSTEELADNQDVMGGGYQRSNTLAHVCWHRYTSLSWDHLKIAMENQLSGYLLRKFKNSHGWQRLWVVFGSSCLYFYKTYHDDYPLASLPLLGYIVTIPTDRDGINKDYVMKLVFKNHIYFFRAESEYTFKRWMDIISSATTQPSYEK